MWHAIQFNIVVFCAHHLNSMQPHSLFNVKISSQSQAIEVLPVYIPHCCTAYVFCRKRRNYAVVLFGWKKIPVIKTSTFAGSFHALASPFKAYKRRLWLQDIIRSDFSVQIIKSAIMCSIHFISGKPSWWTKKLASLTHNSSAKITANDNNGNPCAST